MISAREASKLVQLGIGGAVVACAYGLLSSHASRRIPHKLALSSVDAVYKDRKLAMLLGRIEADYSEYDRVAYLRLLHHADVLAGVRFEMISEPQSVCPSDGTRAHELFKICQRNLQRLVTCIEEHEPDTQRVVVAQNLAIDIMTCLEMHLTSCMRAAVRVKMYK